LDAFQATQEDTLVLRILDLLEEYRKQFEEACFRFLGFAAAHTDLARSIAAETAAHACETGSGRVGRTTRIAMDEKAALAVRAHIADGGWALDWTGQVTRSLASVVDQTSCQRGVLRPDDEAGNF